MNYDKRNDLLVLVNLEKGGWPPVTKNQVIKMDKVGR